MATEIAQAYIHLFPSFEGVKGEIEKGLGGEGEKAGASVGSKFSSAFGKAAKVASLAVTGAATAIGAVVKSSVESFADYEQLIGGVETLFKNSASEVEGYARQAFKTAGLSANDYMETVTSFSASLLQSLGGDTDKAAKVADQAIIDMADNANKMGSSMESIQNAYQGFAKQNYTMLDNLKLGYGGTKSEMERLLEDATKLSGVEYDIESFSDIAEAIHVIQGELKISGRTAEEAAEIIARTGRSEDEVFEQLGTTAKEASETISGSLSATKAAWANLLTGIADDNADFGKLIDDLIDSGTTALGNLLPRVQTALKGVGTLIKKVVPELMKEIPSLITDTLPEIIKSAISIVSAIGQALLENAPLLIESAFGIIQELGNGLVESLPTLIPSIVEIILSIVETLLDNLDMLIDTSIDLITALAEGLINALPILIEKAPIIIGKLLDAIVTNAPKLLQAGLQLILTLAKAIITYTPQLLAKVPEVVVKLVSSFIELTSRMNQIGQEYVNKIKDAIASTWNNILSAVSGWVSDLVNKFLGLLEDFKKIGSQIVDNIKDSIANAWGNVTGAVSGWVSSLFSAFDVSSFKKIGTNIVSNIKQGIADTWHTVTDFVSQKSASVSSGTKTTKKVSELSVETESDLYSPVGNVIYGNIGTLIPNNYEYAENYATSRPEQKGITQVFNFGREVASPSEMARQARLEAQYGLMRGVAIG